MVDTAWIRYGGQVVTVYTQSCSDTEHVPTKDLHIRLPERHDKYLKDLVKLIGLDKSGVIKLALFELAVKHGIATEFGKE